MDKGRYLVEAHVRERRPVAELAAAHDVHPSWIYNPPPQLAFRACLNCHQNVHGSNHPAGNRFLR